MAYSPPPAELSPEQLRAGVYTLLARLLAGAPDVALLVRLRAIAAVDSAPNDALATAWADLRQAAEQAQVETLAAVKSKS